MTQKKSRRFPKILNESDFKTVIQCIEASTSYYNNRMGEINRLRDKTAAYMMYYTCMRPAEALGLSWEDIDFENRIIKINPKNNHEHNDKPAVIPEVLVPIILEYRSLLNQLGMYPKYLFFSQWTWEPITEDAYGRRFQRIVREAGISKLHYYDEMGKPHYTVTPAIMRYSSLTKVWRETHDPYAVSQAARHVKLESSWRYCYLDTEDQKDILNHTFNKPIEQFK